MLTLYARYSMYELRALQAHCLDFCIYQHDKDKPYSVRCTNCPRRRVCKDFISLAHYCETLINSRKFKHC